MKYIYYKNSQHPAHEPKVHIGTFRRRGQGVPFLDTLVTVERNKGVTKIELSYLLKENVHLQHNVKQIIFKQILSLKCEE